jgi:hypothetical protein
VKLLASCARKGDYRGVLVCVVAKVASRTLRGDGTVSNDELTQMEHPTNDSREASWMVSGTMVRRSVS